jgi:hypothetical protein
MNAKRTAAAIPLMPAAGPLMTGETIQTADLAVILPAAAAAGTAAGHLAALPAAVAAAAAAKYKGLLLPCRCR